MKEIKAFQCDFCPKCYAKRSSTASHQRACKNNPARRNCITCVHSCEEVVVKNYPSPDDFYQPAEVWEPWCDHHKKLISDRPYFDDCDMERGEYGEPDYPLPGTCHHYAYKGYAGWREPRNKEVSA